MPSMKDPYSIGNDGEQAVARWLKERGRQVEPSDIKTFDLIVDGRYGEVKSRPLTTIAERSRLADRGKVIPSVAAVVSRSLRLQAAMLPDLGESNESPAFCRRCLDSPGTTTEEHSVTTGCSSPVLTVHSSAVRSGC